MVNLFDRLDEIIENSEDGLDEVLRDSALFSDQGCKFLTADPIFEHSFDKLAGGPGTDNATDKKNGDVPSFVGKRRNINSKSTGRLENPENSRKISPDCSNVFRFFFQHFFFDTKQKVGA